MAETSKEFMRCKACGKWCCDECPNPSTAETPASEPQESKESKESGETKFTVWEDGDPSVGIQGRTAEVVVWVEPDMIEDTKQILKETFSKIFDVRERSVFVMTEEELTQRAEEW